MQIPFTVNNCNTLCFMGIFCDVRHHIQRLTVFLKISVYYRICCNGLFGAILLRLFIFLISYIWIDTICPNLHRVYNAVTA